MRIAAVFALFTAVAVTSVAAYETNAQRFARGLPPNPPVRRGSSTSDSAELLKRSENSPARRDGSGTDSAEHHHPSVKPHHSHHGDDGDDDKGHKDDEKYGRTHVARDANPLERRGSGTDSAERYHPSAKPHGHHDGDDDDDDDNGDDNYGGSDAQRLARGLPSNPLVRRGSGTDSAEKHHPSAKPKGPGDEDDVKCKTVVQCCNSVSNCENPVVKTIAGLIKAKLPNDNVPVGLGCSPHKGSCSTQTVCCDDNSYDGVIAIGCISINVSV